MCVYIYVCMYESGAKLSNKDINIQHPKDQYVYMEDAANKNNILV